MVAGPLVMDPNVLGAAPVALVSHQRQVAALVAARAAVESGTSDDLSTGFTCHASNGAFRLG